MCIDVGDKYISRKVSRFLPPSRKATLEMKLQRRLFTPNGDAL
jgi:hypothetical protein